MEGEVLQVPLALLREVARDVAGAGEVVGAARARSRVVYDAGPAQARVGGLVREVESALFGLEARLAEAASGLAETAEDLADTDRRERVRLFELTMGYGTRWSGTGSSGTGPSRPGSSRPGSSGTGPS